MLKPLTSGVRIEVLTLPVGPDAESGRLIRVGGGQHAVDALGNGPRSELPDGHTDAEAGQVSQVSRDALWSVIPAFPPASGPVCPLSIDDGCDPFAD